MNTRTLIVDDEPGARADLRWLLSAHAAFRIVGEAATFASGRARLEKNDYDVVFLDVQLVGGNGFDLVPHVWREARIVFVTAFDQHALRAFEVNALDYLLKPVSTDRFSATVARLRASAGEPRVPPPLTGLASTDTVLVHTDTGDRFVPVAEISAIFSNENYSDLQMRTGGRLLTRRSLKTWEEMLPSDVFMRVHRQAIVNVACVEAHRRDSRETAELQVAGARAPVAVSRSFLGEVEKRIGAR